MLKDKYKQNLYFWSLLGALFGFIDGIFINAIYYNQLNSFFIKLVYIVSSLNFHAIVGAVAGVLFGFISSRLRSKRLKAIFMKLLLFLFVFGYFTFYTNLFSINYMLQSLSFFIRFQNLIDELILFPLALLAALLLYRFYKKIPSLIRLKWKNYLFILSSAAIINIVIWFTLGQSQRVEDTNDLEYDKKQVENDFKVRSDFIPPNNLLLIVVDTLRADHLGCYGYSRNTSPFMDQLASKGTLFENAIVQKPRTSPSIASLFTSLYVHDHGVVWTRIKLPDEHFTLAESYLKHGFKTYSIVASVHPEMLFS